MGGIENTKGGGFLVRKLHLHVKPAWKEILSVSLSADSQRFSSLEFDFIISMPQFCTVYKYKINILKMA